MMIRVIDRQLLQGLLLGNFVVVPVSCLVN
jgi:hypothetical protein